MRTDIGVIRRGSALLLSIAILLTVFPVSALAADLAENSGFEEQTDDGMKLWYDEPAPDTDAGWENRSLPLGNGYMGANVFGLTERERIQITDKTLSNSEKRSETGSYGARGNGLTSFSETYLEFGHPLAQVQNYSRELSLDEAIARVQYTYEGVTYQREYFTSYPDRVMVIRLSTDTPGKLSFTLRPTIPYLGNHMGRTGSVKAEKDTIILSGHLPGYELDYEGQFRVIPQGENSVMTAQNDDTGNHGGTIAVSNADSAVILIAIGTNYQLDPQVFSEQDNSKKLEGFPHPHESVTKIMEVASEKSYDQLKERHLEDYQTYFGRVSFELGVGMPESTTDILLQTYKNGTAGEDGKYLETLLFQYGRYLLIASSRQGALPPNLQGAWNRYDGGPWTVGYWHNINIEMNYWPVFSTNLAEMFIPYTEMFEAFLPAVKESASAVIEKNHINQYDPSGDNGWSTGTGFNPYYGYAAEGNGYDGNATGALMAEVFWDYYEFTKDEDILRNVVYPAVSGSSNFMWRVMEPIDGKMLASPSGSPENDVNNTHIGTAWDQQLAYSNHLHTLEGAEILGISEDDPILTAINSQIDLLDPVIVGYSGQIKEFREEQYYGEFGEYNHRHLAHMVGLYPASLINSTTPAWMDAAKATLQFREEIPSMWVGWPTAFKMNLWARAKDGNSTYAFYQRLIQQGTYENLWNRCPPFQIDGNFGGTAGVAEMLLQSHEGYLEPLPAIPDSWWEKGSYKGLVGRGAFEVDASWSNGQAEQFTIRSKQGENCRIHYYNIAEATIVDAKGQPVTVMKENADLISFATEVGGTYVITNIPAYTPVQKPSHLHVTFTENGNKAHLQWAASPDAGSYNIYRSQDSEAEYHLVAQNVSGTSYTQENASADPAHLYQYCVRAVRNDGHESDGVTYIVRPVDTPAAVRGKYIDQTALELYVDTDATEAKTYNVYRKKADDTYELLCSSAYRSIVVEDVAEDTAVFVAVVENGREGAKVQAEWIDTEYIENILLRKPITISNAVIMGGYPAANAVDGNSNTRYATNFKTGPYSVTIDLQGTFQLDTLYVEDYRENEQDIRSNETTVEVSEDGGKTWKTVIDKVELTAYEFEMPKAKSKLELNAIGNMLRITFNHTKGEHLNYQLSAWEIQCSGMPAVERSKLYLQTLLEEAQALDTSHLNETGRLFLQTAMDEAVQVFNQERISAEQLIAAENQLDNAIRIASTIGASWGNVLAGKEVTMVEGALYAPTMGPEFLTDEYIGIDDYNRLATQTGTKKLVLDVSLEKAHRLNTVEIYDYAARGGVRMDSFEVLYQNDDTDEWISAGSSEAYLLLPEYENKVALRRLVFPEAIVATDLRVICTDAEGSGMTFWELQALGEPVESRIPVTGVKLDRSEATLKMGETAQLKAIVEPADASNQNVFWSTDRPDVAKVENGLVTAVMAGAATITATTEDGSFTDKCRITVEEPAPTMYKIIIGAMTNGTVTADLTEAAAGEEVTLTVEPEVGYRLVNGSLKANDEVVEGGTFAMPAETVTITAEFEEIPAEVIAVTGVTLDQETARLDVGKTMTLHAEIAPADATNQNVIWSSNNSEVATVTDGNVTAVAAGAAIITVTTEDGGFIDTYNVTVTGSESSAPAVPVYVLKTQQRGGGNISPANKAVSRGGEVTFTITPDAGYYVADVLVDGKSAGAVSEYTFQNVSAHHTITAVFSDGSAPVETVGGFTDVTVNDWFAEAVAYAVEAGLMNGTSSTTFSPKNATTRGMIVTILYRLAGSPEVESDGATWWSDARAWAMETGVSDGTNMDKPITREQLATMLYRYVGSPEADGDLNAFIDASDVSEYAVEALKWAVAEGVVNGKTGGILDPRAGATRAETAAMFMRL